MERRLRNSHKEGPVTHSGTGSPMELLSIGGAEGTGGSYLGARVREAGPPCPSLLTLILDTTTPTLGVRVYDVEASDDKTSCGAAGASCNGGS